MITSSIRYKVFERDGFCCQYCGRAAPKVILEVDHIRAKANGGSDALENLITSCQECNRAKSAGELPHVEHINGGLAGKFFQSYHSHGKPQYQGHILSSPTPDYWLAELTDGWGAATAPRLFHISTMAGWQFFETAFEMRESYFISGFMDEQSYEAQERRYMELDRHHPWRREGCPYG